MRYQTIPVYFYFPPGQEPGGSYVPHPSLTPPPTDTDGRVYRIDARIPYQEQVVELESKIAKDVTDSHLLDPITEKPKCGDFGVPSWHCALFRYAIANIDIDGRCRKCGVKVAEPNRVHGDDDENMRVRSRALHNR